LASYQHPVDAIRDLDERPARAGAALQHLRFRSLTYLLAPFVPVRILGATGIPLRVTWSEGADDDLDDLAEAVEDDDDADRLVQKILDAAESLVDPVSNEEDEPLRSHEVEGTPFTLTYRVQDTAAEILSVKRS
jgi:plasmid stabilization system protein ParE